MRAVDLPVDVPGVEEQNRILSRSAGLALVQEPKGAGEGDGVEHVGPDGDHDIDAADLNELAANLLLGGAGVGGGIGHDEAGAAFLA